MWIPLRPKEFTPYKVRLKIKESQRLCDQYVITEGNSIKIIDGKYYDFVTGDLKDIFNILNVDQFEEISIQIK